MTLTEIAILNYTGHLATKPVHYYTRYDDFLNHHKIIPNEILEIGTYLGESTKILAKAFPFAKIVTIDIEIRDIDFSYFPNVKYLQADQTNPHELLSIVNSNFPNGIDLVIEDAAHIGYFSKICFDSVFPFVKSKGAYFIEDWGTGYWDSWLDGSHFQEFPLLVHDGNVPKRIQSHDFGMVGFVKSLVDMTHESAIKSDQFHESKSISRIQALEFGEGMCMVLKK